MPLFRRKVRIEDFAAGLIEDGLLRAVVFFQEENQRAHVHLNLTEDDLKNIGGGITLFFLARRLQELGKDDPDLIRRATKAIRRAVLKAGGNADAAQDWWKYIDDDARIIHDEMALLEAACRAVWHRKYGDRPFKEHGPIKSFAYLLQMEVEGVDKFKLV